MTGTLVDLGAISVRQRRYTAAFWASARGAIALVRTAPPVFDLDLGRAAIGGYEPGKTSAQAAADYTVTLPRSPIPPGRAYSTRCRYSTQRTPGCSAWWLPGPGCPTTR